jgi:hypothetical protein
VGRIGRVIAGDPFTDFETLLKLKHLYGGTRANGSAIGSEEFVADLEVDCEGSRREAGAADSENKDSVVLPRQQERFA